MSQEQDPDLSHVAKELADPNRKITALELWNNLAADVLVANSFVKMTKNGSIPVKLHYEKIEKGIEAIKHFEISKHRVLVDAIIYRLEGLSNEYSKTSVIRFARRLKIRAAIESTKTVLLIVTNTPPPEGARVKDIHEEQNQGPRKPATK